MQGNPADVTLHIHVHHHADEELDERINQILRIVTTNESRSITMTTDLTSLTDEVHKVQDTEQAAIKLIEGLSQQVKDAGTDQAALQSLTDQLDASANALAAAVVAKTPAAPTAPTDTTTPPATPPADTGTAPTPAPAPADTGTPDTGTTPTTDAVATPPTDTTAPPADTTTGAPTGAGSLAPQNITPPEGVTMTPANPDATTI